MAANSQNRDLLVRQLAWQHEMGIDEILLDEPAPDEAVTMAALVPVSYTHLTLPTTLLV